MPEWLQFIGGAVIIGILAFAAAMRRQQQKSVDKSPLTPMGPASYAYEGFSTTIETLVDPPSPRIPTGADPQVPPRYFKLAVVGESFANADGTSRQEIIEVCAAGEPIALVPEPDNPRDKNAVKVCRHETGEQVGYLRRGHGLSRSIKNDCVVAALHTVHGRYSEPQRLGIVLDVWLFQPPPKPITKRRKKAPLKETAVG